MKQMQKFIFYLVSFMIIIITSESDCNRKLVNFYAVVTITNAIIYFTVMCICLTTTSALWLFVSFLFRFCNLVYIVNQIGEFVQDNAAGQHRFRPFQLSTVIACVVSFIEYAYYTIDNCAIFFWFSTYSLNIIASLYQFTNTVQPHYMLHSFILIVILGQSSSYFSTNFCIGTILYPQGMIDMKFTNKEYFISIYWPLCKTWFPGYPVSTNCHIQLFDSQYYSF